MEILKSLDVIFLYLPLGHAIGRVACLLAGCCWGNLIKLNIFGNTYVFHNPIPLYAIIANSVIFIILKRTYRDVKDNQDYNGIIFSMYLISYGVIRFIFEYFRTEPIVALMTNAQFVMLFYFITGMSIMILIYRRLHEKRLSHCLR